MVIGIIIAAILIVIAVGAAIITSTRIRSIDPSSNNPEAGCTDACKQLQQRRLEVCQRENALTTQRTVVDSARKTHDATVAATAVATVITAALWIAVAVPALGLLFLTAATAASIVLAALVAVEVTALGALTGSETALTTAQGNVAAARRAELDAVAILREKCKAEDADACINRPRPC